MADSLFIQNYKYNIFSLIFGLKTLIIEQNLFEAIITFGGIRTEWVTTKMRNTLYVWNEAKSTMQTKARDRMLRMIRHNTV